MLIGVHSWFHFKDKYNPTYGCFYCTERKNSNTGTLFENYPFDSLFSGMSFFNTLCEHKIGFILLKVISVAERQRSGRVFFHGLVEVRLKSMGK